MFTCIEIKAVQISGKNKDFSDKDFLDIIEEFCDLSMISLYSTIRSSGNMSKDIYPSQLNFKKTNQSDNLASYFDLTFTIEKDGKIFCQAILGLQ